ncbi:hypothetical protein PUR49_05430 [Streptomyces sp. BE147]|uniref:hypothetical protein n=1 Tax=Streptomyces sp. BE147 TaxID=3002524 RepID=UPI002E7883AC|nr:hypothetical protein [Streptomyces sp. BE147]MEE1735956.1 hypothetical protein [Streptomyces sp. BE147]
MRAAHAFWDDIEPKERAARLATAAAVCWIIGGVALAERRALWVLLAAWCISAWWAGRPDADKAKTADKKTAPPGPDAADMADIVRELGTGTGVLLTRLRDQLLKEYPGTGWTTKDVRGLLASAGVRVREGVRVSGAGNGPGVHRDDIPAPLSPTTPPPPVGVVAAGQDANANANNVTVTRDHSGAQITVTPNRQNTTAA